MDHIKELGQFTFLVFDRTCFDLRNTQKMFVEFIMLLHIFAESEILKFDPSEKREAYTDLQTFLRNQMSGALRGVQSQSIDKMCDLYKLARGSPDVSQLVNMFSSIISTLYIEYTGRNFGGE